MRHTFPMADIASLLTEAEARVAALEPSEETMRKRGYILVRRGVRPHWRRTPKPKVRE